VKIGWKIRTIVGFCTALIIASFTSAGVAGAVARTASTKASAACPAVLGGTFLQPSSAVFAWTASRYQQELGEMHNVGIGSVIDQWTVDMDADQAYYPDPTGWYPRSTNMVGMLASAAAPLHMGVWLGLGNVYDWQAHASDASWLGNQLYVDEQTANQLWSLYPHQFTGWYISNEVNDSLLSTPAAVGPMTSFFTSLAQFLQTHDGDRPVMTSPTYSGLNESTAQFAQSVKSVLGAVTVLNVQDGGGSGYIAPSDISNWFSALSSAFTGTRTALWQDADMYGTSGPMPPAQLQADLQATCGYASARTGFSFSTQMGPLDLGTSTYYNAYKAYLSGT
jgi:uncharacterized protein DUF4434